MFPSSAPRASLAALLTLTIAAAVAAVLLIGTPRPAAATSCSNGTVVPDPASNPGLVADCGVLLGLKDPLRGSGSLNWGVDRALADWDGIRLEGTPPRVATIRLIGRTLSGTIPAQLGQLPQLTDLDLRRNQLSGRIPAALGDLAQLTYLSLHDNRLSGPIPAALGTLTQLEGIYLHNNQLSGAIPATLGRLPQLLELVLHNNRLSGPIPAALGALPRLEELDLAQNRLSGRIPAALGDLPTLLGLRLNHNQLTGPIPAELGKLTGLLELYLNNNRLAGLLPGELGHLTQLQTLYLRTNRLRGPLPPAWGHLAQLRTLYLNNNRISGAVPPAWGNLGRLRAIFLRNNALTGCLPAFLPAVLSSDVHRLGQPACPAAPVPPAPPPPACRLGTVVPDPGSNPGLVADCIVLETIRDPLRGSAALNWSAPTALRDWDGITVSGTSPPITGLAAANWRGLTVAATAPRVTGLALPARQLTGQLPPALGDLAALTALDLTGNTLTGPIPATVGNLAALRTLALANNRLNGGIPAALGTLADLRELNLRQNRLSGNIPATLGDLAHLERLFLDRNMLLGVIPPELGDLDGLTDLFLANNQLSGCLPRALRNAARHDLDQLPLESCALPPTTLSYDAPSPTGTVTTAGSYAFLDDPDDLTSAVDTYEELRDGTTTALLIHQEDAGGTSQAAFYNQVEPGDLMEWRQADDCFVRYKVLAVEPDPTGTAPRKLLRVEWMTYAFTGCSGPIPVPGPTGQTDSTGSHTLQWEDLPDLGGESLTTPIRHGLHQIIPEGWTGATETPVLLPLTFPDPLFSEDIAVARQVLHWREPVLPDHWEFIHVSVHGDSSAGYVALWTGTGRGVGLRIIRNPAWVISGPVDAVARPNNGADLSVIETRVIAGRPAWVSYGVPNPTLDPWFTAVVEIYDPETDSVYTLHGLNRIYRGPNIDALIAVAASLFADEGSS